MQCSFDKVPNMLNLFTLQKNVLDRFSIISSHETQTRAWLIPSWANILKVLSLPFMISHIRILNFKETSVDQILYEPNNTPLKIRKVFNDLIENLISHFHTLTSSWFLIVHWLSFCINSKYPSTKSPVKFFLKISCHCHPLISKTSQWWTTTSFLQFSSNDLEKVLVKWQSTNYHSRTYSVVSIAQTDLSTT